MRDVQKDLVSVLLFWTQAWYERLYHFWMREIDTKTVVKWGLIGLLIIGIVGVIAVCVLMQLLAPLSRL